MLAYNNRRYSVEIVKPQPQTQKTNVGIWIRGTIGKGLLNTGSPTLPIRTFRVRRGNGYYGTKIGELIQDQYDYNVSDPDANNIPTEYKLGFAAAVLAWQQLTDTIKKYWNAKRMRAELHMSGYNLFISHYLRGLI